MRRGFTLIDVMVGVSIVVILFGGIYMMYYSVLDVVANTKARASAATILQKQIEIVHNLPYDKVGTQGGLPSGVLPQTQNITSTVGNFMVYTHVRNIDDPFDGTFGGSPNDTAPADYKMVEFEAFCTTCNHFNSLVLDTFIAPKNLENTSVNGSLFVTVFDAAGQPVPDATVRIVNSSTIPTIDFTDSTNQKGILQLVDVPTSTLKYQVLVSKAGYSSDQTYPIGAPANPNPTKPNLTVASQSLTQTSFQIDKVGTLNVHTVDGFCAPIGSQMFTLKGSKLIGTNPNVLKYSATSTTGADGMSALPGMEWGTYSLAYAGTRNVMGTSPFSPLSINPDTLNDFYLLLTPSTSGSLLVTVRNAVDGSAIQNASVNVSGTSFNKTFISGHQLFADGFSSSTLTDGVTVQSGSVAMAQGSDGYSTTTSATFISRTFDFGSSQAKLYGINYSDTQAANTSLKFQIAATNDIANWNYVGPDGTSNTFFSDSDSLAGLFDGNRYLRYKAIFSTQNENVSPVLTGAELSYSTLCAPAGQVFMSGLASGNYTIQVSANGFPTVTSTVSVGSGWQQADIQLSQ